MLYRDPCVFVIGNEYQIAINTTEFGIVWLEVGGKTYRNSRNGLMISETLIHKITVPMAELDAAKGYRVCFRALPERRPYFPQLGAVQYKDYAFRPVDASKPVRAYMLADTHSRVEEPTRAAKQYGDIDLLILAGDVPAESKTPEDIRAIFDLTSNASGGEIPVIFARGNHDYRGRLATDLPDYIGTQNGNTWFTFRIGGIWGVALDCGEDKNDDHIEYGGMVDCHDMRLAETQFLKDVIARADEEYLAPGVATRIAISHLPFMSKRVASGHPDFDIEKDIFAEWTQLLNEMKLDCMLSGHMHDLYVTRPGDEDMRMPANFPVVVGSGVFIGKRVCKYPGHEGATYLGIGAEIAPGKISVTATDDAGHAVDFAVIGE